VVRAALCVRACVRVGVCVFACQRMSESQSEHASE
jgi:hypothetical protein